MRATTRNRLHAVLLGGIVLQATVMSGSLLRRELDPSRYPVGEDGISAQVARFAPLWRDLRSRGIRRVGFVTDVPLGRPFRDAWFVEHHIVRYALRPLTVVDSPEEDFVVGSFAEPRAAAIAAGLEVEQDYGDGVVLYRRAGR